MHRRLDSQIKFVYVDQTLEIEPRIFYVGKGNLVRVRSLKRNKKHKAISERYGCERVVIATTKDDFAASELEIEKIAEYNTFARDYHVCDDDFGCNFTRGGEGFSGVAQVEKQRRSIMMSARWSDPEQRSVLTQLQNSEETKHKKSLAMKAWIETPDGAKHLRLSLDMAREAVTTEARVKGQNQPETKELKSKRMKEHCSKIETKDKKSADAKRNWTSDEYREKQKQSREGWLPSEEHKRQISEKLKLYWKIKKEQQS